MNNKYKKLTKNTLIFTIGNLGSTFISFLLLPLFTSSLTTEEYGTVDFINITISLLAPIITLNIVESILRFTVDNDYDKKETFTTSITMFIIVFLSSLVIVYGGICLFNMPLYILSILILCGIGALYPIFQQFVRGIGYNKIFALSDILYTFVFACSNIFMLTVLRKGIVGYFLSYILANTVCILFLTISSKLYLYFDIRKFNVKYLKEFIEYSVPMIPNSLSWWIMEVSDRYIVTFAYGISALGVYSVANKIPQILRNFYNIFYKAWQVASFEESKNDSIGQFYSIIFNYLSILLTLVAMLIITGLNILMTFFIGRNFYEAIYYIPILVTSLIFYCYSSFLGTVYTSMKNTKVILKTSIISAIINLIINILFIKSVGPIIAAISTFISYAFLFIYRFIDVSKYIKIELSKRKIILSFILLALQSIIIFFIKNIIIQVSINIIITFTYVVFNYKDLKPILYKFKFLKRNKIA